VPEQQAISSRRYRGAEDAGSVSAVVLVREKKDGCVSPGNSSSLVEPKCMPVSHRDAGLGSQFVRACTA